jgi:hypothetical protein
MLTARPEGAGRPRNRRFPSLRYTRFGRAGAEEIAPGFRPSLPNGSLLHLLAILR